MLKQRSMSDRMIALGIFLSVLGLCGFTSGSHVYVTDEAAMYFMSSSMVDHHWFDVSIHPNTAGGKYGLDGLYYMPFGFLQPLLAIPFLLIGRLLKTIFSVHYLPFFCITWFNWVVCSILAVVVYLSFRLFDVAKHLSLIISFATIFSTPFWIYSQTFFTEPLTALFSLLAWFCMISGLKKRSFTLLVLSGLFAGATTWIRPLGGLVIPALLLYGLLYIRNHFHNSSNLESLTAVSAFSIPAGFGVSGYLAYNLVRFGSALETGYDKQPTGVPRNFTLDWHTGMKILLCSPGKSVLLFAPLLLLVPIAVWIMIRRRSNIEETVFALTTGLLYLIVLSRWARVEGEVAWGPRLILPAIPILFLCLIPLFQKVKIKMLSLTIVLALCGTALQIPGVLVNFSTFIQRHENSYFSESDGSYVITFNPFPGHLAEMNNHMSNLGNLQQRAPEQAFANRNLEQINPDGILDFWWIYMWIDRVPISLIASILIILSIVTISGFSLIAIGLRTAPN